MFQLTLEKTLREKQKKILWKQSIRIILNEESQNLQVLVQSGKDSVFSIERTWGVLYFISVNASLSNQPVV